MRPVGVGLESLGPMGVVGFRMITRWPASRGLDRFLLGQKLRALVVADHIGERDRRVFIDDQAVAAEVHRGHAGGVDEALHLGFAGQPQQLARPVHIGLVHRRRIGNPEPVVGGDMDHGIAAAERGLERLWLGQIAHVRLARDAFKIRQFAVLRTSRRSLAPSAASARAT